MRRIAIPSFTHIKQLALLLKTSPARILKDISINARKRVFIKSESSWMEYKSPREIVVPFAFSKSYAQFLNPQSDIELIHEEYSSLLKHFHKYLSQQTSQSSRQSIAVLLGHNDHGKTTLLQQLSNEHHFIQSEKEGMTQTIRTVSAEIFSPLDRITIVDTPGQDLFYRMRNYGSAVAEIFMLVIAADEGILQQTKESIGIIEKHLHESPRVVVVINKIDKFGLECSTRGSLVHSSLQPLLKEIQEYEALSRASIVCVSALTGSNVDELRSLLSRSGDNTGSNMVELRSLLSRSGDKAGSQNATPILRSDKKSGTHDAAAGVGMVLNIEQSTQRGILLHILVIQGSVSPGSHFAAGGWSGTVRAVSSSKSSDTELSAGAGGMITIALDVDCGEPLPLGMEVLFLPAGQRLSAAETPPELPSLRHVETKHVVRLIAEQQRLEYSYDDNCISDEDARQFRLALPRFIGASVENSAVDPASLQGDNDRSNEDALAETAVPAAESSSNRRVVLKVDSHVTLHTILDALDDHDEAEADAQTAESGSPVTDSSTKATIIRHGAGDVTPTDVLVADAAGAEIVAFNVRILASKHPPRDKKKTPTVVKFTRMSDVVAWILGKPSELKSLVTRM